MKVDKKRTRAALVAVLITAAMSERTTSACTGGDADAVLIGDRHPDQPLQGFVEGRLGVLQATYARTYLIVAYRYLAGLPLEPVEQQAALRVICERQPALVCGRPEPRAKDASARTAVPEAIERWYAARRAALGAGTTDPKYGPGSVVEGQDESGINCLDDAFLTAEKTLAARVRGSGVASAPVKDWIARQDAVFTNCNAKTRVAVPAPASGDPKAPFDFAYQTAAAAFYARDYAGAEAAFRKIAADAASPWHAIARYLIARVLLRRAESQPQNDVVLLAAAKRELEQTLADSAFASVHAAARLYLPIVRAQLERAPLKSDLGVQLGRGKLGAEFAATLANYAFLHGDMLEEAPQAKDAPPESDRLATFIHVIRAGDFGRAARLWDKTRSEVWLVAALMAADSWPSAATVGTGLEGVHTLRRPAALRGADAKRLDAILTAAAAVSPTSPAYLTAQYYRLSLRGDPAALGQVRARLRPADGPSARNAFQELAVRNAASLDAIAADAMVTPAGIQDDETGVLDQQTALKLGLMPLAADVFARALPTSLLVEAARSDRGHAAQLASVFAAAYVRAGILDDQASAAALADAVKRHAPTLAPFVDPIQAAQSAPERRFEFLYLLAKIPSLSFDPPAWAEAPRPPEEMKSTGGWWWCSGGRSSDRWSDETEKPAPIPRLAFLGDAQRATAAAERQRLERIATGPTFLATALVDLAPQLPDSDRLAEALSIAVAGGRYACRDANTTKAGKRAFTLLHKRFPKSRWTRKTVHYY